MLTPTGQINPNFIQNKFWDMHDLSTSLAGQDPEFRTGLTTRWSDCLNMANVRTILTLPSLKAVTRPPRPTPS